MRHSIQGETSTNGKVLPAVGKHGYRPTVPGNLTGNGGSRSGRAECLGTQRLLVDLAHGEHR